MPGPLVAGIVGIVHGAIVLGWVVNVHDFFENGSVPSFLGGEIRYVEGVVCCVLLLILPDFGCYCYLLVFSCSDCAEIPTSMQYEYE